MEERIIAMRKELLDFGSDAGAETIHWHLAGAGFAPPSVATIYRLLKRRGFITPEPRKRPRASYVRFEANLPNECWQTDMTHWHLADGTEVEILTFLDDYSRRVFACDVFVTVTGPDVRRVFARTTDVYSTPASVLSDNGAIYNAGSRGGRTGFESDLLERRVLYKHSTPYHPQTCGKVERWHRTLKKFLAKHPASSLFEMQAVLDDVVRYYNEVRPHRARNRQTPLVAYEGRDKMPAGTLIDQPHYRIRFDVVDVRGHVTLRYLGKLRHLNVGWAYRGQSLVENGQDGGFVSALLIYALENDVFDAALVSGLEGDGSTWRAEPRVARTRQEVFDTAKSRYTYSANLLAYPEAVEQGAERIAVVGMGCMASAPGVMAARKAGKIARRLSLTIGLLCSKTFDDAIFEELFEAKYAKRRTDIKKMNMKGVFQIWTHDDVLHEVPLKEATPGRAKDARAAQTSPPSTPTSPRVASARSTNGPSSSCAPTRAAS
jgi:transposase InsO family protein